MKIAAIVLALYLVINTSPQIAEFEKQALAAVQRRSASLFDDDLPRRPFGTWFKEIAGEGAGVVWQLSECGDPASASEESGDIPACAEANAVLANGSKVVVMVLVGGFKKGLNGEPSFFGAVIEHKDQFYQVSRLRDLPRLVRDPGNRPVSLPGVTAKQALLKLHFQSPSISTPKYLQNGPNSAKPPLAPPPPPQKPRKVEEVVVQGWAVTRVKPVYLASARRMNAHGPVEVRIIISPEGKVIEAEAISGHIALRTAAVEAARRWVFKPTTIDGVPVNTESILTFVFARGSR
jgi:TonB family protein